jgi:hypothetical protein
MRLPGVGDAGPQATPPCDDNQTDISAITRKSLRKSDDL